jgi:hypothetical protein
MARISSFPQRAPFRLELDEKVEKQKEVAFFFESIGRLANKMLREEAWRKLNIFSLPSIIIISNVISVAKARAGRL